jgi:hypothetical protein
MKLSLRAFFLLALCFRGSVAADWKMLRARDKLGQQTDLGIPDYAINDYVNYNRRPDGARPYMFSRQSFDGVNSVNHPTSPLL